MDIGRTTVISIAAAAAITVAHRIGRRQAADLAAEMERITVYTQWLLQSQQDLRRGQQELRRGQNEMHGRHARMGAQLTEVLEAKDELLGIYHAQLRAVAGAYEATEGYPDDLSRARSLRRFRQPGV